jgi:hypothetical protein
MYLPSILVIITVTFHNRAGPEQLDIYESDKCPPKHNLISTESRYQARLFRTGFQPRVTIGNETLAPASVQPRHGTPPISTEQRLEIETHTAGLTSLRTRLGSMVRGKTVSKERRRETGLILEVVV